MKEDFQKPLSRHNRQVTSYCSITLEKVDIYNLYDNDKNNKFFSRVICTSKSSKNIMVPSY